MGRLSERRSSPRGRRHRGGRLADVSSQEIVFVVLGIVGLGAAVRLVTARNVVHAALYLVVSLAMVGGTYLVLAAEFVAFVQVLIYVGAIVVLLLFSLMLTRAPIGREALDNQQRGISALVALGILAGLAFLIQDAFRDARIEPDATPTGAVGVSIFQNFVLPFELVSVLLLAALIGAVVLARKDLP
ncbi:MAG: NADH-quinone oxidoreductase subunit J [Actinobacteria bacterium]|nr:NADH-quinone oxidoreductase subunit J [Actinomycetota bacterium]